MAQMNSGNGSIKKIQKEEIKIANKHGRKFSKFLTGRKFHINTTLRFHVTPVRKVNFKIIADNILCRSCLKYGPLFTSYVGEET